MKTLVSDSWWKLLFQTPDENSGSKTDAGVQTESEMNIAAMNGNYSVLKEFWNQGRIVCILCALFALRYEFPKTQFFFWFYKYFSWLVKYKTFNIITI